MSNTDSNPLCFDDPTPIEVPVTIGGAKHILREASADVAAKHRNAAMRCSRYNSEGNYQGAEGMADLEPLLVSHCLYVASKDGKLVLLPDGSPDPSHLVPLAKIRSWRDKVQKALFERIMRISDMEARESKDVLTKRLEDTQRKLKAFTLTGTGSEGDDPNCERTSTMAGSA